MEFVVRGKTYNEETAIPAILEILESVCAKGNIKLTELDPRFVPFKIRPKFHGIICSLTNDKPTGFVVIDKDLQKVIFYTADGLKESESMTFAGYLIDTDYNR